MEEALASTKKKAGLLKARPLKMGDVLNRLRNHKEWSHVLKDPELQRHLWAKHNVVQELWYHLNRESRKLQSMAETGPPDSFVVYPFPARKAWELQLYTPPEKSFFIDWLAVNRVVGVSAIVLHFETSLYLHLRGAQYPEDTLYNHAGEGHQSLYHGGVSAIVLHFETSLYLHLRGAQYPEDTLYNHAGEGHQSLYHGGVSAILCIFRQTIQAPTTSSTFGYWTSFRTT
uniref:Uncharacterized protein n=1 Tax=Cucumis sativus TaxID=3659 RepID=A0A0A0KEM0_CUCSA